MDGRGFYGDCLIHFVLVLAPFSDSLEGYYRDVSLALSAVLQSPELQYQEIEQFYQDIDVGLGLLDQDAYVFSELGCRGGACKMAFYVSESNRSFVLSTGFLNRLRVPETAVMRCDSPALDEFVRCEMTWALKDGGHDALGG